uniref:Uncharacterized protein n=1 Tax=Aquisalinus luteolus TaxID=1566827 RepID=A0A8J3ER22_9PROT|nr:hypothetical protein GCM10011355_17320 [Aquisalinus luteolus]
MTDILQALSAKATSVEAHIARHGGIPVRGPEGALAPIRLDRMPIPVTNADARPLLSPRG